MDNINEENKDHSKSIYTIPSKYANVLGDKPITGSGMTTWLSRLKNKNRTSEEQSAFEWLENENDRQIEKIDRPKRDRMNTGAEGTKDGGNNFKNTWTETGVPNAPKPVKVDSRIVKGKRSKANNVEYYESYEKEIKNMKYLIEYMNNNKPKIT